MIYETAGALAIVFVGLVLYASIWMDLQQSTRRFRQQSLSTGRTE